jgi:predicted MFS family arabinose efflux permease
MTSYRDVLHQTAVVRLLVSAGLARTANQMQSLAFLLLAITSFHSPAKAGVIAMLSILPGLMLSPLAGNALDQLKTSRCVIADYLFTAALLAVMAVLAARQALSFPILGVLAAVSSLTTPLSQGGTRALVPAIVPKPLWNRANALDSISVELAYVAGPPAAGVCFAVFGSSATLAVTAAAFGLATLPLLRLSNQGRTSETAREPGTTWSGVRYVLGNPALRGSALSMLTSRIGFGALTVALPVLTLRHLHAGTFAVGLLWATAAVAATASHVVFGRVNTNQTERRWICFGMAWAGIGMFVVALSGSLAQALAGMVLLGSSQGPIDITTLSLAQRRTDPAWMGRSFSITQTLASVGLPLGALLGGSVAGATGMISVATASGLMLSAALLALLAIPARRNPVADAPAPAVPREERTLARRKDG